MIEETARRQNPKLKEKLDRFLRGLESNAKDDISSNSQILAEIIENFSNTYGIKPQTITELMQDGKDLNIEILRRKLIQLSKRD